MPSVSMCLGTLPSKTDAERACAWSRRNHKHVTLTSLAAHQVVVTRRHARTRARRRQPVRLGHAVRGRLRPFSFVPRQALAVRGERRRALREASRAAAASCGARKRDAFTRLIFWTLRPHGDVLLHACRRKTVKEPLRGLLAALGRPGGSRLAASAHRWTKPSEIDRALANGSNDDVCTCFGTQPHR